MDSLTWVALTGALVWLGIGGYVAFLALEQRRLATRLRQREMLHDG
ncbi:MAG: CcmD family protein [Desulfovibrio sp.]|nr:CcmD family protein [Desulfovibrio sp.]